VGASPLVQFRPIDLDPTPDATGVNEQATFEPISAMWAKEIGDLRYRRTHQRIFARIVSPLEGTGRSDGHVSPYQMPIRFFRNDTMPDHC